MAKIEKSEESRPQLFFDFTWKYVPQLFLWPLGAEKMTFSPKTARVWFDDTYPLNQWHVLSGKILVSPLEQFVKHHFGSSDMWPVCRHQMGKTSAHFRDPFIGGGVAAAVFRWTPCQSYTMYIMREDIFICHKQEPMISGRSHGNTF